VPYKHCFIVFSYVFNSRPNPANEEGFWRLLFLRYCGKKNKSTDLETGNTADANDAEAPVVVRKSIMQRKKYPLCEMLKMYPTMVDAVLMELDKKIKFENAQYSITTAHTKVSLDFGSLLPNAPPKTFKNPYESNESETDFLMEIIETSSIVRKAILKHPLIQAFLHLKWQRFKPFAVISIAFYVS